MAGDAERLRLYWSTGGGAARIAWGTKGDWTRCVALLSEHMPGRAEGYCALLHRRNTGMWTGDKAHRSLSHTPTFLETAVTLGIAHPDALRLTTPKVTPEQDKARWDAYRKRVEAKKKAKAAEGSGSGSSGDFNPVRAPAGTSAGGQFAAGPPRDEAAKAAQENPGARKNLDALQGLDPAAAKAMLDGLSDKDLQDLSRAAYSFKSSDPKVVAQRIAIANALARRGQDVNDHGGLGKDKGAAPAKSGKAVKSGKAGGSSPKGAKGTPRATVAAPRAAVARSKLSEFVARRTAAKPPARRAPARPAAGARVTARGSTRLSHADIDRLELGGPNVAARRQMATDGEAMPDGSFPVRSLADLRKAIAAFERAVPEKREAVKAHLVKRARALGGEQLIPADWH